MDGEAGAKALNASRMNNSEVDMSEPDIASAWAQCVSSEAAVLSWIALGYDGKKKLKLLGTGTGGYANLMPHLANDQVVYGAFKVLADGAAKLVFVASIGEDAGGMVKGRATAHTQSVENALEGTTIGIQVADASEKDPAAITAKLTQALKATVTL